MIEKRRMCLVCGNALQQAGIPCELVGEGVQGVCPHCKKKRLCFNWKVERREKKDPPAAGTSSGADGATFPVRGEGKEERKIVRLEDFL